MIADYSELVVEATSRMGDGSLIKRADMITGFAEADLSRELRVGDMETVAALTTDANGEVALPADFEQVRNISDGSRELQGVHLKDLTNAYVSSDGWAVRGNTLVTSCPEQSITLTYYASLPSLVENGTNWLLQSDPEVYIIAFIKHAYLAKMEADAAAASGSYLRTLLQRVNKADREKRFMRTPFRVAGVTP